VDRVKTSEVGQLDLRGDLEQPIVESDQVESV
jgi:hypothetical protein